MTIKKIIPYNWLLGQRFQADRELSVDYELTVKYWSRLSIVVKK